MRLAALAALCAAVTMSCDRRPTAPGFHLTLAPDSLTFVARQGGLRPLPRFVAVSYAGSGEWFVESEAPWLAASPSTGATTWAVQVLADNQGLALGTYHGTLRFTSPTAWNSPGVVHVRLDITSQAPLASRWVGAWAAVMLNLDLRDSANIVVGLGELAAGSVPFAVTGTRTSDNVSLSLRPATGSAIALNAFFYSDHILRGALTGGGFAGDSVLLFRQ